MKNHETLQAIILSCQMIFLLLNSLIKLSPDWFDRERESCGQYAMTRISIQAVMTFKWKLAAVVLAGSPSNHGLGHRSTMQWSFGFL